MAGFGDLIQKAFYLGVGAASYAGEKASDTLKELRGQSQALVNELVERGELTAEEAQQLLNRMMQRVEVTEVEVPPTAPRQIEILDDEDTTATEQEADALRRQVEAMRQQLEELKRKSGQ
jgi:polyhydroxyalkanoate synthesis regulator phasin